MKIEIKVPAMGESITEATVGSLLKPTGSLVAMDDEILELETDKVNQVLYARQAGTISWSVKPEETVTIGQIIGSIDTETVAPKVCPKEIVISENQAESKETIAQIEKSVKVLDKPQKKAIGKVPEEARISRESFIKELHLEKEERIPSMVQALPIVNASAPMPQVEGVRETRRKMSKIRKVIAARLMEVQRTTAMLTTFNEVDMTQVIGMRDKYKELFAKEHGVRLGFMSFFVKATVSALAEFPNLNSYIDGDEIVHREYYDIGIAVGTERGLIVPVIKNCDRLSFPEIETAIDGYAKRAREGKIAVDDLQGGSFTITNGGVYGSLLSTPILNPPQSGILGMHNIVKRAVVVADQIVIRPMMYLALSYDHCIVDGKEAISFLVHIKNCLEDPARLLLHV